MNYINCPSFSSIFFALYLQRENKDITIITINESVKKYCEYAHVKYIYIKNINFGIKNIWRIVSFKKQIDNLISKIGVEENDNFYLLDNSFTLEGFYLAKEWSRKGIVYFKDLEQIGLKKHSYDRISIKKYTNALFLKYVMKFYLGIDVILLFSNNNPVFCISDKYLEENRIFTLNIDEDLLELKVNAIKNNCVKFRQYDNLIADQGIMTGILKNDSILNLYRKIFLYDFDYVIKEHPTFKNSEIFSGRPKYPDYIPAELLLGNIKKNVISVFSSTLILASKLDNINSISLIELVDWESEGYKLDNKEWLIKESDNKIIFVKSMDELIRYL